MAQAIPQSAPAALARMRRTPFLTLLGTAAAALVYAIPGALECLGYERTLLVEAWRLLTCHWVHLSQDHFLWSAGTFLVLGMYCEPSGRRPFLIAIGATALAVPVAVWLFMPGLTTYAGLSGLDSALFALIAVSLVRDKARQREWLMAAAAAALLAAMGVKIGYEFLTGAPVFAEQSSALTPVPLAHLVGGAIGAITGLRHGAKASGSCGERRNP